MFWVLYYFGGLLYRKACPILSYAGRHRKAVISCAYSITANLNSSLFLNPRYFDVVSFRPLMCKLLTDTVP